MRTASRWYDSNKMNILLSLNCDFCDLFDEDDEDDEERKKHRRCVIVIAKQNKELMNSVGVIYFLLR